MVDKRDPGTLLYTIVQLDRRGNPAGFHKLLGANDPAGIDGPLLIDGYLWNIKEDAETFYADWLKRDPEVAKCFAVRPVVAFWATEDDTAVERLDLNTPGNVCKVCLGARERVECAGCEWFKTDHNGYLACKSPNLICPPCPECCNNTLSNAFPPDCSDGKCGKCHKCYEAYVAAKMTGELG